MAQNHMTPLFRLLTPLLQTIRNPNVPTSTALRQHALSAKSSSPFRHFSSTPFLEKAKGNRPKKDPRISLIRYHLQHPRTPRPLRFSRMRGLRHWTIHRAWMLFRRKKMQAEELELQRLYQSMHSACEELRLLDGPEVKNGGRLYRIAMEKKGIFRPGGVPIEYARAQTETPATEAWNHAWTR